MFVLGNRYCLRFYVVIENLVGRCKFGVFFDIFSWVIYVNFDIKVEWMVLVFVLVVR